MHKIIMLIAFFSGMIYFSNAQSLISFKEQNFELTNAVKDSSGYSYTENAYNFIQGQIVMIEATCQGQYYKPVIQIVGPAVDGKTIDPEDKYYEYTYYKTQAVFLIKATGLHKLYFTSSEPAKTGTGIVKLGLANSAILDNIRIMPLNNSTLGQSLSAVLRQAIFNFIFTGIKKGNTIKASIILPGADMKHPETGFATRSVYDINATEKLVKAATYMMGDIFYEYDGTDRRSDTRNYLDKYDFKDTIILLRKYDSLKNVLAQTLSADFTVERETILPIPNEMKVTGGFLYPQSGRTIVYKHRGNERLIDPKQPMDFLAGKNMRIELSLQSNIFGMGAALVIRVYSY